MNDLLFLLRPGFPDPVAGQGVFYCPACAEIRGVLAYHPQLRDALDIREIDYPRPRAAVAELLGDPHPGCPVLIFAEGREAPPRMEAKTAPTGRRYLDDPRAIGDYLAALYGIARPHP
jgi:Protein of unknown function (DUF3088)